MPAQPTVYFPIMRKYFFLALAFAGLATTPQLSVAQAGGLPVKPAANTQYVLQNGAVGQRQGLKGQVVPLTQNIKLPNGTKINTKSGIVELVGGKITTLHEGDYVRADGGIVFATPASAAAARGDNTVPATAQYDTYVQKAGIVYDPARQVELLNQKIELLNKKISLLSRDQPAVPGVEQIDVQLKNLDAEMSSNR